MTTRIRFIQLRWPKGAPKRFYSTPIERPILVQHHPAPHAGSIRVLLLNRPENRNALSIALCNDLAKHIEELSSPGSAQGVRALVIASSSDKAFCAGADLKERKAMSVDE